MNQSEARLLALVSKHPHAAARDRRGRDSRVFSAETLGLTITPPAAARQRGQPLPTGCPGEEDDRLLTAAGADALAYSRALELEPHSASSSTRQGSLLGGVLGLSEIKSVARFCRRLLDERLQTATGAFLNPTEYDDGAQLAGRENVAALGT